MDSIEREVSFLRTPIGTLRLEATESGLSGLYFPDREPAQPRTSPRGQTDAAGHLRRARAQLQEYFKGQRREFQLELDLRGSDFHCEVWQALLKIPYGRTRTYGQIAREMGGLALARAVGGACAGNPVSIIVPCHRVIGSNYSLTGYGGGLGRKERLLRLEGADFAPPQLGLFG